MPPEAIRHATSNEVEGIDWYRYSKESGKANRTPEEISFAQDLLTQLRSSETKTIIIPFNDQENLPIDVTHPLDQKYYRGTPEIQVRYARDAVKRLFKSLNLPSISCRTRPAENSTTYNLLVHLDEEGGK